MAKKNIKVKDLKPRKDAKGGGGFKTNVGGAIGSPGGGGSAFARAGADGGDETGANTGALGGANTGANTGANH